MMPRWVKYISPAKNICASRLMVTALTISPASIEKGRHAPGSSPRLMRMPCRKSADSIRAEIAARIPSAPGLSVRRSGLRHQAPPEERHHRHEHEHLYEVNEKQPARIVVQERHVNAREEPLHEQGKGGHLDDQEALEGEEVRDARRPCTILRLYMRNWPNT